MILICPFVILVGPLSGDLYAAVNKPRCKKPAEEKHLESNDVEETKMISDGKPSIMPKPTMLGSEKRDRVPQTRPGTLAYLLLSTNGTQ